ncbi:factor-independent urate hydroxylase [Demequina sp. NBRC 110053]|uniref:factor-independent urate hydroxylase n=1 Tax=Demequina sp. NBRC 110053 TaxID=1570342 RepID=UPI000A01AB5D|nr:urate oxidase [Demequina sp. NBRC 110053]
MGIRLGDHQYGKAENRIVRIVRDSARHEIRDVNVSTCLRGTFDDAHLTGDQANVLPTDTQKQTAYAFAKTVGLESIERYGLALATHFVTDIEPVTGARVEIEEYPWVRVTAPSADAPAGSEHDHAGHDHAGHDHAWVRAGQEVRTATVTVQDDGVWITGGLKDLTILKSTGSEFHGFLEDEYTVLEPTTDRVMATSLVARWRFGEIDAGSLDFDGLYNRVKAILTATFANHHSLALQQTMYEMGKAVLEAVPELVEVRLAAPNKHHFLYDLGRFGIDNAGEVFHADDRPYGLIQASVIRDDAPDAGRAWDQYSGLV